VTGFTPIHGLVGGAAIALALAMMLIATGRIAGLSGVVAGLFRVDDRAWRAFFIAGMLAAGTAFELAAPGTFDAAAPHALPLVAVSGVLVGFGTRLANGCTSGHGLCGMARLSKRSIVATMTFLGVAIATATVVGTLS
jgi:uncharacterized protein